MAQDNDIDKKKFLEPFGNFNDTNKITIMDMTDWNNCTNEEIEKIMKGTKGEEVHIDSTFEAHEDDELWHFDGDDDDDDEYSEIEKLSKSESDDIRENFPETWIFEHFNLVGNSANKSFKTPNLITSWMISAFSVNEISGIAFAPQTELVIKKDFFMQMILPFSARCNETIEIKMLIHKLTEGSEEVNATISLRNRKRKNYFEIFNESTSSFIYSNNYTKHLTLNYSSVKSVSFFIRSTSQSSHLLHLMGYAEINEYHMPNDRVFKNIRIEPIGVKTYENLSKGFNMHQDIPQVYDLGEEFSNSSILNYNKKITQIQLALTTETMSDATYQESQLE